MFVPGYRNQDHPQEKEMRKTPWLSEEALQIAVKRYNARDPGSIPGLEISTGEGIGYPFQYSWSSLVVQLVKNLPATWES